MMKELQYDQTLSATFLTFTMNTVRQYGPADHAVSPSIQGRPRAQPQLRSDVAEIARVLNARSTWSLRSTKIAGAEMDCRRCRRPLDGIKCTIPIARCRRVRKRIAQVISGEAVVRWGTPLTVQARCRPQDETLLGPSLECGGDPNSIITESGGNIVSTSYAGVALTLRYETPDQYGEQRGQSLMQLQRRRCYDVLAYRRWRGLGRAPSAEVQCRGASGVSAGPFCRGNNRLETECDFAAE